jgi:hypothetical protein
MTSNSSLLEDLSLILGDKDFDVIIKVGEDCNTKEFHAHSVILQTCSPYFKSAFSSNWIVKENGVIKYAPRNSESPKLRNPEINFGVSEVYYSVWIRVSVIRISARITDNGYIFFIADKYSRINESI